MLEWVFMTKAMTCLTVNMMIVSLCFQGVVAVADAVIAAIDRTALATYLARKTPEEGPGSAARKKEAEEQKAALLEALEKKASALLELHPSPPETSASADSSEVSHCPQLR